MTDPHEQIMAEGGYTLRLPGKSVHSVAKLAYGHYLITFDEGSTLELFPGGFKSVVADTIYPAGG